jgi:hypothetical protein
MLRPQKFAANFVNDAPMLILKLITVFVLYKIAYLFCFRRNRNLTTAHLSAY